MIKAQKIPTQKNIINPIIIILLFIYMIIGNIFKREKYMEDIEDIEDIEDEEDEEDSPYFN
jgi:hypothetical protein